MISEHWWKEVQSALLGSLFVLMFIVSCLTQPRAVDAQPVLLSAQPEPPLNQLTPPPAQPTLETLQAELAEQAKLIRELQSQITPLKSDLKPGERNETCKPKIRRLPVVAEEKVPPCETASDDDYYTLKFKSGHNKGFGFSPFDAKKTPFEMKINGWIQLRHQGFARDVDSWTDNSGQTRTVRNRNAFDIERARLTFKGYALDKRLTYFYQLDGDSDGRHTVDFFDYWWAWRFSDSFNLQFGKRKVTAGRRWLLGARRSRFTDRPMANDFFRPDRTVGLFGQGTIGETGHYEVMVGNGYRTANLPASATDDQLAYAFTHYVDPWGDFGSQVADYDYTCCPLLRIGQSFTYAPNTSERLGLRLDETNFLRLTDGTLLSQTGALAPGVTITDVDVFFYSVDLSAKWRGWSFSSEFFFRWLEELQGDGAIPYSDLFQRGFFVEGGTFICPKRLDVNVRYSEVRGLFGDRTEYGAAVNWYPIDTFRFKVTFDVNVYDGSPLNNSASDILVGDDGVLFRTQIQAEF